MFVAIYYMDRNKQSVVLAMVNIHKTHSVQVEE